jgi:hypothetical protein
MSADPVQQIDQATVAHALWKVRLLDASTGDGSVLDRSTAGDCHACNFGKWLDSGADGLSGTTEFPEVFSLHEAFHGAVGTFIDRMRRERIDLDTDLGGGSIRDRSSQLALRLLRWRDRLAGTE